MKKILLPSILMTLSFILMKSSQIRAQSFGINNIKAQIVKDWERAKTYTVDYFNTMPADKYSFKAVDVSAVLHNRCCTLHGEIFT
jgi:hypothetical protein